MQDGKGRRASVVILLCSDYFQAINFLTGGRTMPGFWLVENKFYSLFCNYTPYTKETFTRKAPFKKEWKITRLKFAQLLTWHTLVSAPLDSKLLKPLHKIMCPKISFRPVTGWWIRQPLKVLNNSKLITSDPIDYCIVASSNAS